VGEYFDYDRFQASLDQDISAFLEQSLEAEEARIDEELERINRQLEQRDQIKERNREELDSKLDWYLDRLEKLYNGFTTDAEEKQRLKQKIEALYRELREERRRAWLDKQDLEAERRDLLRELAELDETDTIFDIL